MKIISIKQKNKRTTNCIVSILDEQNGTLSDVELSMDIVVKERLAKEQIIDNLRWEQILVAQRIIDAKQSAYKYASKVNKTQKQVIKFLQTKNFSSEEINEAMTFLQNFNLIDDSSFAKKYINDTLLTKNIGPAGLMAKLISKGIDKQIATQAIQKHYPEDLTPSILSDIVHKKLNSLSRKNKTKDKIKASIFNHVLAKGFSFDEAKKAVELAVTTINNN